MEVDFLNVPTGREAHGSQNHRITAWLGGKGLRWVLQRGASTASLGKLCQCITSLTVNNSHVFYAQSNSPVIAAEALQHFGSLSAEGTDVL